MHSELAGYRPGELVRDRYEVHEPLGIGRFGAAVLAVDTEVDLKVILKIVHPALLPTEELGHRFLTGVRALGRHKAKGLTRVYGANCEGDRYFVIREFIDGVPLMRLLEGRRSHGRVFEPKETLRVLERLAEALDASKNICHGSLIPTKIWITPQGAKIADAGLVRFLPLEACVHLMNKARRFRGYIAPELWAGHEPDSRTDVFCATALLGEMATQIAFDGRPEIFEENAPDLCGPFASVLRRGLSGRPEERFATICELTDAFCDACGLVDHRRPSFAPQAANHKDDIEKETEDQVENAFRELGLGDDEGLGEPPQIMTTQKPSRVHEPPFPVDEDGGQKRATEQVSMENVIREHLEKSSGVESKRADVKDALAPGQDMQIVLNSDVINDDDDEQDSIIPSWDDLGKKTDGKGSGPENIEEAAQEATGRFDVSEIKKKGGGPPRAERPQPRPDASKRHVPRAAAQSANPKSSRTLPRPNIKAPPPSARSAAGGQEDSACRLAPKRPSGIEKPIKEVTQEINMDDLEDLTTSQSEVTQEIDLDDLTPYDSDGSSRPPSQRAQESPEEKSTKELIRRAERLEGVDPRLVRAAHALETARRTPPIAASPQGRIVTSSPQERPEGIDPKLLRAAAQLDSRKTSSTLPSSHSSFHTTRKSLPLDDIDPRLLRAAARLESEKRRVPENRVVISSDEVTQTESGIMRRNAEFVSFLGAGERPRVKKPSAEARRSGPNDSPAPRPDQGAARGSDEEPDGSQ